MFGEIAYDSETCTEIVMAICENNYEYRQETQEESRKLDGKFFDRDNDNCERIYEAYY